MRVRAAGWIAAAALALPAADLHAQGAAPADTAPGTTAEPPTRSALDAALFYQLLIGEIGLRTGDVGTAYSVILDAARRTRDEALFRRAVDIALQARAGDQALVATRAWRTARPQSLDAIRFQLQILAALNRVQEAAEPLRALLGLTPERERGGLIAAMPGFLQRAPDRRQAAELLESVLQPMASAQGTAVAATVAMARGWLAAGEGDKALALAQRAAAGDPDAPGPALLALELTATKPAAEGLVRAYLERPKAEAAVRLAYARNLVQSQRYVDAARQLETVTREQPEWAVPYLTLGALRIDLRQWAEGEQALLRYVELVQADLARREAARGTGQAQGPGAGAAPPSADAEGSAEGVGETVSDSDDPDERPGPGLTQAWLLLAQVAEQRGDLAAAERWLARVDDPRRTMDVLARRASLMARQGQLDQARRLLRQAPERSAEDARAKRMAEAALLREGKRWQEAFELLGDALAASPDDTDLLYEQAMMAEKLGRLGEMERLLRRVIELKPDNAHAHNALGYSLADRGLRLPEARELIRRALQLQPGDPFITDSLGWVEFRLGNLREALRLLREAYAARPDAEIGAHLGEVLWTLGERDDARRVWREVKLRDASNDVLRETLARLRVDL